jgi:hypothetical protein
MPGAAHHTGADRPRLNAGRADPGRYLATTLPFMLGWMVHSK